MHSMDIFRRNLKPLMAALTLMAMITFVFDDSMRAGSSMLVPVIFGLLFGGAAFIWGTRSGKQNEYLAMGAVVGIVLGLALTVFSRREDSANDPLVAGLSRRDIGQLKSRRESANRIITEIYFQSHQVPEEMLKKNPFMAQIAGMDAQQTLPNLLFNFGRDLDKDVVFGHVLRQEAQRLGITVSKEAVEDFMQIVATAPGRFVQGRRLMSKDFEQLRQKLHLSDHDINALLREELEARVAYDVTAPRNAITPEQRWEDFRKLTVKQEIEAATIPVELFVARVADPSDSDLLSFFNDHAEKFPGVKGEPGFRQPTRVQLAYLEADYEAVEKTVTPPTDEEVELYYEDNKESFIDRTPKKTEKKDDDLPTEEGDKEKKDGEKSDKTADPKSDDKPKGDSTEKDKPKETDTGKKPDTEKPKTDSPDEPKSDKPKSDTPADKPKSDPQGAAGDDKVTAEKADSDPKAAADKKTEEPKPADESQKDDPKKPADEPKPEKSEDDKPKETEDKPEVKPEGEVKPEPETKPEIRYKPFEDVKESIRDQLLRERTLEKMRTQIDKAVSEMRDLGSRTIGEKTDKSYLSPEHAGDKLKAFGEKLGLKYRVTPLLSAAELRVSEDHPIGGATDPIDEGTRRQQVIGVVDRVFGRGGDSTHTPEVAEDQGTKNRFAYWAVERSESHVPKFDESGVREQVLKAWKLKEALPKAEERAKKLAKLAAAGQGSLTEVMAGQTVTGEKDGKELTVLVPSEFSHYTRQGASAPQLNPLDADRQPVELSRIDGLENFDEDFMNAVDRMKVGATEVIPNAVRSAFFVVHLKSRTEVSAEADAPQRQEFLEKWPFGVAADQLASVASFPLRREWVDALERKYNVVWPVSER